MTPIEKKSLEHILSMLDSYNNYTGWSALNKALIHFKVDSDSAKEILKWYEEGEQTEYKKVVEAKNWVKTLLEN